MSNYHTGTTYTGSASPPTVVLPPIMQVPQMGEEPKTHRRPSDWETGYRRLRTVASLLAGAGLIAWIVYAFVAFFALVPNDNGLRVLLACGATILTILAPSGFMAAMVARLQYRHADEANDQVVAQVVAQVVPAVQGGFQTLRGEMGAMHALVERVHACTGRVEQVAPRLAELERRMEAQRSIAAWAAQVDRRLAEVQHAVQPAEETVPRQPNGAASPLDFSDDALRGYFRGFYDREPGGEEPTAGV